MHGVLAGVIGRANRPFLQTMILGAGRDQHALPGEAVMDARGMIGRVYLSGRRTSWVILLTDLNSRIPVTITASSGKASNIPAIMTGDNSKMPVLEMVSRTVTLHAGDQVTSSGDGGLLPAGLPIGTVVRDGDGWRVSLLADATEAQDVEVLNFAKPPENPPAAAELPMQAAGLKPLPPPPPAPVQAAPVTQAPPVPAKPKPVAPPPPAVVPADGSPASDEDVGR
jgi:rod shape-determining protein MreC